MLLEMIVVLAILALLVGLTIPAVQYARNAAARAGCASSLRQLALATHGYEAVRAKLPPGCDYPIRQASPYDNTLGIGVSWQTSILPYVEQDGLWKLAWDAYRERPRGNSPAHDYVKAQTVNLFTCPADSRRTGGFGNRDVWGLTSYLGVAGTHVRANDGVFHKDLVVRMSAITDGTSNTLMIGERPPGPKGVYGGWYAEWGIESVCPIAQILAAGTVEWAPEYGIGCRPGGSPLRAGNVENACDANHFWSLHGSGANFAFADGSVRFLRYSTRTEVLAALATRAGGEIVGADDY